jgi:CDP-diglyceride synthetase
LDNLPRLSFYLSGIIIVSGAFTLFTTDFLIKIADPGITGTLFLLAYGLVYMNITFVVSRRFMRRLDGASKLPYLFAFLVAFPPLIWSYVHDAGLFGTIEVVYLITVVFGCILGGYFGQRAGIKAQAKFKEELYEYLKQSGQLPDELKRPHDNLNKN